MWRPNPWGGGGVAILTPVGSKVVQVIVADEILPDLGHRLWRAMRAQCFSHKPITIGGVKLLTIMEGETTDILLDRLDIGLLGPYSPN